MYLQKGAKFQKYKVSRVKNSFIITLFGSYKPCQEAEYFLNKLFRIRLWILQLWFAGFIPNKKKYTATKYWLEKFFNANSFIFKVQSIYKIYPELL